MIHTFLIIPKIISLTRIVSDDNRLCCEKSNIAAIIVTIRNIINDVIELL